MNLPTLGRSLANAFALAALPLWWSLDPSSQLGATPPSRDAWEAVLAEAWDRLAAGVEVRTPDQVSFSCDETGILADGTTFPSLGYACDALGSVAPALRECGFSAADGFGFGLLVRSDAKENRAVARSGLPARDACAERVLGSLPLADRAPPGGALVATGTAGLLGLQIDESVLSREEWDALLADAWDDDVSTVRFWHPEATSDRCFESPSSTHETGLCRTVRSAAPALRACGLPDDERFNFAVLVRSGSEENEAVAHSADPAHQACIERVLGRLPLAGPPASGGSAIVSGHYDLRGLERPEASRLWNGTDDDDPALAYASHVTRPYTGWEADPAASVVVDHALVGSVHERVACPSAQVGTRLSLDWRDGAFTAKTDPAIPCVESNAQARSSELLDLLAAAVDTTEPRFAERVAEAGPPRGWRIFHLELWVVLPETAQ